MLVSFTLRASMDCPGCKMSLPLNGIIDSVSCYHCGQVTSLDAGFWTNAIEPGYFGEALGFEEGEGRQIQAMGAQTYRLAYGKRTPRCQACKGPDLDPAGLAAMVAGGRCFCPACGQGVRLRPPDAIVQAVNPRAWFVVGETSLSGAEQAIQRKSQPVLFACMGCGGTLRVDGSTRAVACEHCGQSNYLPDGLWTQINPVPKEQVFFLVCDYDQAILGAKTVDAFDQLFGDDANEQKENAAKNPNADPAQLALLAEDRDEDLRELVAKHPRTPRAALERLARDTEDDVLEALIARADVDAALLDVIAQSTDDDIREKVARDPRTAPETLQRLAHDSDDDVKNTAHARLRELGVKVAGEGFFKKLFS